MSYPLILSQFFGQTILNKKEHIWSITSSSSQTPPRVLKTRGNSEHVFFEMLLKLKLTNGSLWFLGSVWSISFAAWGSVVACADQFFMVIFVSFFLIYLFLGVFTKFSCLWVWTGSSTAVLCSPTQFNTMPECDLLCITFPRRVICLLNTSQATGVGTERMIPFFFLSREKNFILFKKFEISVCSY